MKAKQFHVYPNPGGNGFVVNVQSDLLSHLNTQNGHSTDTGQRRSRTGKNTQSSF